MLKTDNPAERLATILQSCTEMNNPHAIKTKTAWKQIFRIQTEETDDAEILMKVAEFMRLLSSVNHFMEEHFKGLPWQGTVWWVSVNKAFQSMDFNGTFETFTRHINSTVIAEVNWLALLINSHGASGVLDDKSIEEMIRKVNLLKEDILISDLTDNMKKQFLRYLNKIVWALEDYRIAGVDQVLDSVESAVGHLAFDQDYRNCVAHDDIGKKFISVISFIADTVTIACGFPQLAPFVSNLLLNLKNQD